MIRQPTFVCAAGVCSSSPRREGEREERGLGSALASVEYSGMFAAETQACLLGEVFQEEKYF